MEHGVGGGADEGGEGEETAEEGQVQELPLVASCRHFAVVAWEGVSGSVSHRSRIPPTPPPFSFFSPDFLLVLFLAKLSQKLEDREPKDAVQWPSS